METAISQQAGLIAITPGEPAGIGPDICLQLAKHAIDTADEIFQHNPPVFFASPALLSERAELLGLDIPIRPFSEYNPASPAMWVEAVELQQEVTCGQLDKANAPYVLACLDQAADACLAGRCKALVTGPVQKSIINEAGIPFSGHTEYLAAHCGREKVVMMLATDRLRVALVTTHLPLAQVASAINPQNLELSIRILHKDLQDKFAISSPHILVCGLNPHAGENGHLGHEEIEVMAPVLDKLRKEGMQVLGPLPADTLFTPKYLQDADAVLAMYHDQGLPVLKSQGFGEAVNITLGLPIIRTSVDHGTALDLAGSGKASMGSLLAAYHLACGLQVAT